MREYLRSSTSLLVPLLLIALCLASIALAARTVQAAGGGIRVVETGHKVNFPSGVNVTATIESDAAIQEIRVFYRPAGSRRWGYAYADFDPGTRVVATRSIPVRESTYIAPGADVEYFFEIRDVDGNVFKTERGQVEYLDQRFDWKRVQVGPLELVYHDIGQSRVEDVARELREDLRRVEEVLRLDHSHGFKGVIYNSYADANAAFPVQSQTTTDHGTFAGYAFPEQGVFVGQGLDPRIIVHESAHLLYHEVLGHRTGEDVAWLSEGFASYMEPDTRVRSSSQLSGRTPPLRAMKAVSGTPSTIPLFYYKAKSVVAHLIEEYGEGDFRALLGQVAGGRNINDALIAVYGFDEDGLDASWAGLPIPAPPGAHGEAAERGATGRIIPAHLRAQPGQTRRFRSGDRVASFSGDNYGGRRCPAHGGCPGRGPGQPTPLRSHSTTSCSCAATGGAIAIPVLRCLDTGGSGPPGRFCSGYPLCI